MALGTLNQIFFEILAKDSPALMRYRQGKQWVPISAAEFRRNVLGVAQALRDIGVQRADRVAILSENRPEWTATDFACLLLGAVVVPIYPTMTDQQTGFVLRDSGARTIFVSNQKLLQKILSVQHQTPVEHIFVMDAVSGSPARPMPAAASGEIDPAIEAAARSVKPEDLATIIYTSGTTGEPKGVMLTHGNMASNIDQSLVGLGIRPGDVSLSFLPLSHITARHVDMTMLYHEVTLIYVSSPERLPEALQQMRPTVFVGVPRVFEKLHTQVEIKAHSGVARLVYAWALRTGKKHRDTILAGRTPASPAWWLADRLLYAKIRAGMGGRARIHISGGAPLGRELAEWYADIGIRIFEGYGLTETSPVISVNNPGAPRMGTVGKPLANVQVRIAEDGEILVRGPSIFQGYWNLPQETEQVFTNGWFKTGDIGSLDADGFLSVTDRKKDLIKTSGGKYVSPQPIENTLKHHAMIAEAVVFGDRRKFPSVLIHPYFPVLEEWARENDIAFASRHQLIALARVQALYEAIVAEVNRSLASFEKIRQVLLIADEFTVESGTLTASMKVRRRQVQQRIDQLLEAGTIVGAHHRRE